MTKQHANRRFDREKELEICRLYVTPSPNGKLRSQAEIGRMFGCSQVTVKNILSRYGVASHGKGRINPDPHRSNIDIPVSVIHFPARPLSQNEVSKSVQRFIDFSFHHYRDRTNQRILCTKVTCPSCLKVRSVALESIRKRGSAYTAYCEDCGTTRDEKPFRDKDWLAREYVTKKRPSTDIARDTGVYPTGIRYWLKRFGIAIRTQSESLFLSGSVRGSNNPAWKGGVADWEYSPEWKRISRAVRNRDEWTCQGCGEKRSRWGTHLHVHHIDENKFNNHPHNLISLCPACHHPSHGKPIIRSRLEKIARSRPWIDID